MSERRRGPFPPLLSCLLVGLPILYLLLNFTIVFHCVTAFEHSNATSACNAPGIYRKLDELVPAIWRGADAFERSGNTEQARIVRNVAELYWGTGLTVCISMIVVALLWFALRSEASKHAAARYFEEQRKSLTGRQIDIRRKGARTFIGIWLIILIQVIYGIPAFSDMGPAAARTYVRGIDFIWPVIAWFLLQIGVLVGIVAFVRRNALKTATKFI
jgi:hypothetical protein